MPSDTFDVIVIGAGPPGQNVADQVVRGGLSCAVVERDLVGGECSYWSCMPSKALLRPGEALTAARAVPGVPVPDDASLQPTSVLESRNSFASAWNDDKQVKWLENAGAVLFRGVGKLAGERKVDVSSRDGEMAELYADHAVVLCTGSSAAIPDIPGLRAANPWTSREGTSAEEPPRSLAVIGGGAVGTELATAWSSLGTDVTMLVRGSRLLSSQEPFAGRLVAEALADNGVDIRLDTEVERVERATPADPLILRTTVNSNGEGDSNGEVRASEVLVATGRSPRTDSIGIDTVGLRPGDWVDVDDTGLATDVDGQWLYAIGDVNGRSLLTHQGKYQARQAGAAIVARAGGDQVTAEDWGRFAATADHDTSPQVIFTTPHVASIGPAFASAQARGWNVRAIDYDLGSVAGAALHQGGYEGRARIVIDEDRNVIVGATFVGADAAELLHAATIAIVGEVPIERLWHAVPAFPTLSEVWLRLLEVYASRK
jgi:pyruvate/2-oxoglutarate dehydrogenase complex dihydrolipoamide dehydrogenase (E3) component